MKITSKVVERESSGHLSPAIGASVFLVDPASTDLKPLSIDGKIQGTVTDINGRFLLDVDDGINFKNIAITYVGAKPIITDLDTIRKTAVFELVEDITSLDEVTVWGKPTKREKDKKSFPDWLIAFLIPVFFGLLYFISKFIKSKPAQPAKKR